MIFLSSKQLFWWKENFMFQSYSKYNNSLPIRKSDNEMQIGFFSTSIVVRNKMSKLVLFSFRYLFLENHLIKFSNNFQHFLFIILYNFCATFPWHFFLAFDWWVLKSNINFINFYHSSTMTACISIDRKLFKIFIIQNVKKWRRLFQIK